MLCFISLFFLNCIFVLDQMGTYVVYCIIIEIAHHKTYKQYFEQTSASFYSSLYFDGHEQSWYQKRVELIRVLDYKSS